MTTPTSAEQDAVREWIGRYKSAYAVVPSNSEIIAFAAGYQTCRDAQAQPVPAADLHGAVMNIPSESEARICGLDTAGLYAYKLGHRDARHAAAELVAQQSNALPLTTKLVEWAEEAVEYVNNPAMSPSLEREGRRLLATQGGKP